MGQFLRDLRIRNVTVDEAALTRINEVYLARVAAHNEGIPEGPERVVFHYVIRFDEKGYRFVNINDVLKCFRDAGTVERVIYSMDSGKNRQTSGLFGTNLELRLDRDPNTCWLNVSADNKDWVDTTFTGIAEILTAHKSWSRYVRTQWTGLLIQILGVAIGFLISLWAALKISPMLTLENAFVITFFFALLIYSNVWAYINGQISRLIDFCFPNVRFKRPRKDFVYMAVQTLVGGLLIGLTAFLLDKLFDLVGATLSSFFR